MSDQPDQQPEIHPWEDLGPTGLLWLINTSVFHPRGYALAVTAEGFQILGDGTERWAFAETPGMVSMLDERFLNVRELLP